MKAFMVAMAVVITVSFIIPESTFAQDSAYVVVLSPKVGNVIDNAERQHYGFFQNVKDFYSAAIVRRMDGKFFARITLSSSGANEIQSIPLSESSVFRYAEKIENFEDMKIGVYIPNSNIPPITINGTKEIWSEAPQTPYNDSTKHVVIQNQIDNGIATTVTTIDGHTYDGMIIFVLDSNFWFWNSNAPFRSDRLSTAAVNISATELRSISIQKAGHAWLDAGIGFLIGGTIGATVGSENAGGGNLFNHRDRALIDGVIDGVIGGVIGGAAGGAIGGLIGSAEEIDDEFNINGDQQTYTTAIPDLKKRSLFPYQLPLVVNKYFQQ